MTNKPASLTPFFSKLNILSLLLLFFFSTTICFGQVVEYANTLDLKSYLSKQPRNTPDEPIKVTMVTDDLGLPNIKEAINSAGRYVDLTIKRDLLSRQLLTTLSNFGSCKMLVSITIPNEITSIGSGAFAQCTNLTGVTIPNTVTSIGDYAFSDCKSLVGITIPRSVTSIGSRAFNGCTSLASITLPNTVTSIKSGAFNGCTSLKSVTLPNSVTEIGDSAFIGCTSLTSITIPNSVTSIGSSAFEKCTGLTSITVPSGVTEIGGSVFRNCSNLASATLPNSLTKIGDWAFQNCTSLKSITIPNSVTSIGANAFNNCTSITSIAVPKNVTSIGGQAFSKCTNLTSIKFEGVYPRNLVDADFDKTYWSGGRQTGTYTRPNAKSTTWTNTTPPSFPAGFIGQWTMVNTHTTLTIEKSTLKESSSRHSGWILSSVSGDSYTFVTASDPGYATTLTMKLVNGNIEIVGDNRGSNWNGAWKKQ